jgi:hypothetical protein
VPLLCGPDDLHSCSSHGIGAFFQATPEGQAVFYTLLKACFEVVWKGESIVVLREVQVDPPYGPENCKLTNVSKTDANIEASLERVKRIVALSKSPQ